MSTGSAPEPIWLAQATALDGDAEAGGDQRREAGGLGGDLRLGAGEQAQRRQALGEAVGVAVEPQRRLERGDADLVEAQRALQRVAVDRGDEVGAADDEAGLRAAEQLVAGEGDEVGASATASRTVGSRAGRRRARSTRVPEPRSLTSGTPASRASAASSGAATSAVKPSMR